ncbi:MAG: ABC transporter ATP-binding protein, partial [Burkholderiales bacterium]
MLEIEGLCAGYGGVPALGGVALRAAAGEFTAIVGPNGAGKTTLFKTISGIVQATSGAIRFEDRDLLAIAPAARPHLGIAHVPEGRQVFPSLTVYENLEMGAYTEAGRRNWSENLHKIYSWFPVLAERAADPAGALSGGQQQMLAIARGLASSPKLLMLDEPSMGLSPLMMQRIMSTIRELVAQGTTILLVEQNAQAALELAHRGYVLEVGRIVLADTGQQLLGNEQVRKAY